MLKYIFSLIVSISLQFCSFSQNNSKFSEAAYKNKFKKVERIFKHEVKKRKHGLKYDNGPGSGIQISHNGNLDSLISWLKSQSSVEDAISDKCATKISIYPSWTIIGVIFKTKTGMKEMCFYIQEGTNGFKIFKFRLHLFPSRNILLYKKMYEQKGFIQQEKKNCLEN